MSRRIRRQRRHDAILSGLLRDAYAASVAGDLEAQGRTQARLAELRAAYPEFYGD